MRVGVVDYGVGNLRSVMNALRVVGASVDLCRTPEAIQCADKLVLPGVGAFGEAMHKLAPLRAALDAAPQPILGLCLGMQLMAEVSFEHGEHRGLGWFAGEVRPLPAPIVGWNTLNRTSAISRLEPSGTFYFVHGFHFVPRDPSIVTAEADGVVAVIEQGQRMGAQFHPEKSQRDGLRLLERFLAC